jgi:saccharopine dehydrogenase-like NADP-dependent oxidoreductase
MNSEKKVLVLGAGRSAGALIHHLLTHSTKTGFRLVVADADLNAVTRRLQGFANAEARQLDAGNTEQLRQLVSEAYLVISLLPPALHPGVARLCIQERKHFITASYNSDEVASLHQETESLGLSFIMECGLDPGIDHMSAMEVIHRIKHKGGKLTSFKSFTGGLVAPESDNNPWHYKITWNPRNVVLAGQGVAKFKRNNLLKYVPYHKLFTRLEKVVVPGYGDFEGYFNRDSLQYREVYGLTDIPTIIRGTLRRPGFCNSWNALIQMGLTDDSFEMEDLEQLTYRDFINMFLVYKPNDTVEKKVADYLGIDENSQVMENLSWLGLFESVKIGLKRGTPAMVIQHLLEQKLVMGPADKDMIVMQHQFEYQIENKVKLLFSSMVMKGDKNGETAMSKTVGLPLALATLLILEGKLQKAGVMIPTLPEIYEPLLNDLKQYGVQFLEEEQEGYL